MLTSWSFLFVIVAESLSMPVEEAGASGHMTPGDERSQSSDDTSQASQAEEPLDAKVER